MTDDKNIMRYFADLNWSEQ